MNIVAPGCRYCGDPLAVTGVHLSHPCPAFNHEAVSVVERDGVPASVTMLLDLARSISVTLPDRNSTWGTEARAAIDAARKDGLCE